MRIEFEKLYSDVKTPKYAHFNDAGVDLHAYLQLEESMIYVDSITLFPGKTIIVPTGLRVAIPAGYEGQIRSRSGLATKGLVVANSPGTIDSGYRGEVGIIMYNRGPNKMLIEHGMRIAQLVIAPVERIELAEGITRMNSSRGEGGFGSSGTK
jgi:dUTP pyrophosphatase